VLRLRGGHCQVSFVCNESNTVDALEHHLDSLAQTQVPCGIFDDPAIVAEIKQACETIRKSMVKSKELHGTLGTE
jgi:hypothetical protein